MNVNIYYGGRGLIDDPTMYVLNVMQTVLEELRVNVIRYNLHEVKNNIITLPQTLKEVDGVILASTVEWFSLNGWMNVFLDACWFYGDKTKISSIYMTPIVMSTTYGEREAQLSLINAWEMLGGKTSKGLCSYVEDSLAFEMNKDYKEIIEKLAEDLYRSVSQKTKILPSSTLAIKQNILKETIDLTPQESEQLSKYASDDIYVKKQKEDIEELAGFYKSILESKKTEDNPDVLLKEFRKRFVSQKGFSASYVLELLDKKKSIVIEVDKKDMECYFGKKSDADVTAKLNEQILDDIFKGKSSFQSSFMKGDMTAKGDFGVLRMLDVLFPES